VKYRDYSNRPRSDRVAVADADVIQEHIVRLLGTNRGELLDNPDYGCNLRSFLYETMSPEIGAFIQMEVSHAISIWEPRVRVKAVGVRVLDAHSLIVGISCYIPEFDKTISFDAEVRRV